MIPGGFQPQPLSMDDKEIHLISSRAHFRSCTIYTSQSFMPPGSLALCFSSSSSRNGSGDSDGGGGNSRSPVEVVRVVVRVGGGVEIVS